MSVFWRPRGCVLWFDFATLSGSTAYDLSRQKNNGTIYGATWKRGYLVGALSFDGVDDYVSVPDFAFIDPNRVTLEAWVRAREFKNWSQVICKHKTGETRIWMGQIYVDEEGGYYHLGYNIDGAGWAFARTGYVRINEWHHIVGTVDVRLMRIYLDGVFVMKKKHPYVDFDWNAIAAPVRLGWPYWLNGDIALARIYNRVLTEREIKAHYHYLTKPMARVPV